MLRGPTDDGPNQLQAVSLADGPTPATPVRLNLDEAALARLHADLDAVRPDLARRLADIIAAAKAAPSAGTYLRLGAPAGSSA